MKQSLGYILFILAVFVILYLQFCRKNVETVIQPPPVKTVEQQQKEVVQHKEDNKVAVDSFQALIFIKDKLLTRTTNELLDGQDKILYLQQDNDSMLSLLKSDELKKDLIAQAGKIKVQSLNNDSICNDLLANLRSQLFMQKEISKADQKLSQKLFQDIDTCLSNQSKLQSFIDKTKPRNKLALGPVINFYPDAGVGGGLTFINKRGLLINFDVLRMNKDWYGQFGLKKVLSFR